MGPIPANFSLQALVGLQFQQVCIDPMHAQYRFEHGRSIAGSGIVRFEQDGNTVSVFDDEGWVDPRPLTRLVGQTVTSWRIEGTHEFSISIGPAKLRFVSEDSPYEDFVVNPELWVV